MMNDGVYGYEDMELLSIINKMPFDKKIKDKSQIITMNKDDLTRFISFYVITLIIVAITYSIYSIFFSDSFIIGMSIPVTCLIMVALKKILPNYMKNYIL